MDDFTSKLSDQDANLLNRLTGGDDPYAIIRTLREWEAETAFGLTAFEQQRLDAALKAVAIMEEQDKAERG